MNAALLKRLESLEASLPKHGDGDPARIHEVLAKASIAAPEPLRGEDTRAWLKRVPTASLDAVMRLRGAHA